MLPRLALLCALYGTAAYAAPPAAGGLRISFLDVEGGQATLFIAPSGQSLLIDTGWPGNDARDAGRIVAAAHKAGLKKIDYLLVTHFHIDHAGGVPDLAARIPIGTFIDHGPSVENDADAAKLFTAYQRTAAKGKHLVLKPGDKIPLAGLSVEVVSAAGSLLSKPLAGAGAANTLCGSDPQRPVDTSENAQSLGVVVTLGRFRALDLGDLTWNKEMDLVCPANRIGKIDLYIVSHHGMNMSGSATSVHAFAPRVAIMDNGARKGGTPEAFRVIKSSPGLEDIWQLHRAVAGGDTNNASAQFLANLSESPDPGNGIEVLAHPDGSFTVTNDRNEFSKDYPAK